MVHACQQLSEREGLDDATVGAGLQADDLVGHGAARRKQ
jgi:hypothetical protein